MATYILVAAIVGMAISVVLGLNQIIEKRESFQTDLRVDVWLVSQVELEHLRLLNTLDNYHSAVAGAGIEQEQLLTRFDMLWSRLLVLSPGEESIRLQDVVGLSQTVGSVIAALEKIEPAITNLQSDDVAAYRAIRGELSRWSGPIHTMVMNTTNHQRGLLLETAAARSGTFWQVIGYFIGILVSGTILILFLILQNRETRKLLSRAGEAEIRANDASNHLMHAIESFTDGFVLFDQDGRLQICNERYLTIFPKVADLATPGRSVEELARQSALRGQLWLRGVGVETWLDAHLK